jgi:pimeloyl-ACP methyl ester carboxylesterase
MRPVSLELSGTTGSIAALSFGNPANPPLLALHGWLDNAASFLPLASFLQHYYLIALDFAGHGLSAHRPPGTKYHLVDHVADVAHVIKSLELERFNLIGHSLGAGVSILYAATYPESVEKLVLIDGVGPLTETPVKSSDRLRKSIDVGTDLAFASESPPKMYPRWQTLVEARLKASPIAQRSAELLVRRSACECDEGIFLRSDRRLRHPSPIYFTEATVMHFIRRVTCPTLVVLAKQGMVIQRDQTRKRLSAFRDVTVSECEGQHHLHMDQPADIANNISRFLAV